MVSASSVLEATAHFVVGSIDLAIVSGALRAKSFVDSMMSWTTRVTHLEIELKESALCVFTNLHSLCPHTRAPFPTGRYLLHARTTSRQHELPGRQARHYMHFIEKSRLCI